MNEKIVRFLRRLNDYQHEWTDIELVSNDGGAVPAHRIVLAMYHHTMAVRCRQASREKPPFSIQLPFSFECLKLGKELLYKGKVEVAANLREEFCNFNDHCYLDVNGNVTETISQNYSDFEPPVQSTMIDKSGEEEGESRDGESQVGTDGSDVGADGFGAGADGSGVGTDGVGGTAEGGVGESDADSVDEEDGIDANDRTVGTTSREIIEHIVDLAETNQPMPRDSKYALRYWMAIIMCRCKDIKTELQIQEMMGIPRNTTKTYLAQIPPDADFQHPVTSKRRRHPATNADLIVEQLCHMDVEVEKVDANYTLRLWTSVILRRFYQMDCSVLNLHRLLHISRNKIDIGASNGLDPTSTNLLAATD